MELWELVAREACRDTLAQYTHSGDRFRLDEFASAFCEDGVLEVRGSDPARGRAAIAAFIGGRVGAQAPLADAVVSPESQPTAKRIVRHNVTNVRFVSVAQSEARVESYFTVFTEIGLDHFGRYRDRLIPVADRWLIAHRFVSVGWHAPNSVFT